MDNISSGKGRKASDMTHNFPKGQIKGSLSGWQSSLASRAWCRTVSGRECQGYFYKQLQRYQQCGAGAEIPIFADEISWPRVPVNESACQQAQEGRRKQRPTVIKQVTVSDLGRHRGEGPRLWLSQPGAGQQRRAWAVGCWVTVKGDSSLPRWKGPWDEGPDGEEMDSSGEPWWSMIPRPLLNLKSVWRIWPALQTPEIAKRMIFPQLPNSSQDCVELLMIEQLFQSHCRPCPCAVMGSGQALFREF